MGTGKFRRQRRLFDFLKYRLKSDNCPLVRAAVEDNLRELKNLAEQGHDLGTMVPMLNTLLHIAVACGSLSVVGYLLDVEAIYVDFMNFRGWTALFIAAGFTRDLRIVRRLLDAGAKPTTRVYQGIAPLDYILNWAHNFTEEHAAITRLLMEIPDGQFPVSLHQAVLTDPRLASTLIEAGADVNEGRFGGNTPLHVAVAHGKVECVQLLLEANADVNRKNEYGFPPISLCLEDKGSLLKLLLQNGAALDQKDLMGQTLVHQAVFKNKADILARVLEVGASVNSRDFEGNTPLHLVIHNYFTTELVQVLIKAGADVDATNCKGETPLLKACYQKEKFEMVAMLLYHEADPSIANNSGTTPFMASLVLNQWLDTRYKQVLFLQELLFLYETDFDRVDYSGNSVLGLALLYEPLLLPELIAVRAELALSSSKMEVLLSKPGMFQKLRHMINNEKFLWCGFDSVLSYAVVIKDANTFHWAILSEELPRVLDLMYNFRTQTLLKYGSLLPRLLTCLDVLIYFALKTFDKETACEYVYILLSHGYQPYYNEAEYVFGVLGQCRLFSLCSEIDLQPSKMTMEHLLPTVMFDVSQSVDSHINKFICHKKHCFRVRLNLESIASFFAGKFAMKLQQYYNTSVTRFYSYRATNRHMGLIETMGYSLPSLRELCRDCIRDTVCATQKVQTYGDYRRMIRSMTSGIYRDVLLFKLPLYSVDKERVSSLYDRLNALSQPIELL